MRVIYKAIVIVLLGIIVIFAFQNLTSVTVSLFAWSATMPVALVVVAAYLFGMVTGGSVRTLMMRLTHDDSKAPPIMPPPAVPKRRA